MNRIPHSLFFKTPCYQGVFYFFFTSCRKFLTGSLFRFDIMQYEQALEDMVMKLGLNQLSLAAGRPRHWGEHPVLLPAISVALPGLDPGAAHVGDLLILPKNENIVAVRRLVVLLPENDLDECTLAQRIWSLAAPGSLDILFLVLASNQNVQAHLRRRLATLAAIIGHRQIKVSTKMAVETNWVKAVEQVWQLGDILLCFDRHMRYHSRLRRQRLGIYLAMVMNVPVYLLAGMHVGLPLRALDTLREGLALVMALFVIIAFAWLQISVDQVMDGGLLALVLCLTVFIEMLCLLGLNDWMG